MEPVIGIDLGTTNSCVAIVENDAPVVIPNRGGYKTTPSMVAITEAGKRLVGHIAKRQAITNAENTVYAAKRLIGRKWASPQVKNAVLTSSYRIVEGPHGDVRIQLRDKHVLGARDQRDGAAGDEASSPRTTSGSRSTRRSSPSPPTSTTTSGRRPRTRARSPGSTSSASSTSRRPPRSRTASARTLEQTIAVYDLGGGTFDISILEIGEDGVFKVIATAGDTFLGGEDFDARIIDWLVAGFQERARHRPAPGPHGAAAPARTRPRRPSASFRRSRRPRSTCRSSSRADATRRCTCSGTLDARDARGAVRRSRRAHRRHLRADARATRSSSKRRDRGRRPRRRHDAHAARAERRGAVLRARALQGRAPRRGRGARRGDPGRGARRRRRRR